MKTLVIFINVFIINLYSQQPNFFPLNIGNEYQMYNGYEYQFGKIERDTIYPNGKTYFHLPSPSIFWIAGVILSGMFFLFQDRFLVVLHHLKNICYLRPMPY